MSSNFNKTCVVAATNDWDGVRMADRQLAEKLAEHVPVLYVDPPTSFVGRYRSSGIRGVPLRPRLTRVDRNLARLRPDALPGLERPGIAQINSRLIAWQVRRAIAGLGGTVHTTIDANILAPIMGRCHETVKVYWAQDDWVGLAPLVGTSPQAFVDAERIACRNADIIVAANPLVSKALKDSGYAPHLIPFGCDYDLFASARSVIPAPDVTLSGPIAVFMGHLGDRIDMEIFEHLSNSDISLLLVGPVHPRTDAERFRAMISRPNVQWVGEKPFAELPRYLALADVGLLPYTHSKFNMGSFPLKTLEYLAAGIPVVATSLPAIEWLSSPQISTRDNPHAFGLEVEKLLFEGRSEIRSTACQEFARDHSWDRRAEAFMELVNTPS